MGERRGRPVLGRALAAAALMVALWAVLYALLHREAGPLPGALMASGMALLLGLVPLTWALSPVLCGLSVEVRGDRLLVRYGWVELAVPLTAVVEARLIERFQSLLRMAGVALPECYAGVFWAKDVGRFRLYGSSAAPALLIRLGDGSSVAFATRDRERLERALRVVEASPRYPPQLSRSLRVEVHEDLSKKLLLAAVLVLVSESLLLALAYPRPYLSAVPLAIAALVSSLYRRWRDIPAMGVTVLIGSLGAAFLLAAVLVTMA